MPERHDTRELDIVPFMFSFSRSSVEAIAMDILVPGPPRRIPGLDFNVNGPTIFGKPLLMRSRQGFEPRPHDEVDGLLRKHVEGACDSRYLHERLVAVARAMNAGDLALAAIATSQLRLRAMRVTDSGAALQKAVAFVRQGTQALEELMMGEGDEAFATFRYFKKLDLAKVFGEAGDGWEYHHIVEQSSGLSSAEINSTSNIVRIPKLLHEEVNAAFSRYDEKLGMSLHQSLNGTSFEERRAAGIGVLKQLGIIQP